MKRTAHQTPRHRFTRSPRARWLCALLVLPLAQAAHADDAASPWHGHVTQDLMGVVAGGAHRGLGAPALAHLNLTLDGSRWGGASDSLLYIDVLGTGGNSISDRVGDLQGVDNAEAPNTVRLYEAWWQQTLGNPDLWLRVGLQDNNALFNVVDAASLFINSSFGIMPTVSQSGVPIFPQNALGAVLHWRDKQGAYLMGGLYDGVAGKPSKPYGTHLAWHARDGVYANLEGGIDTRGARPTKLALGAWIDTSRQGNAMLYPQRNHGLYAIGQARLWGRGSQPRAVDGFVQWGTAMPRDARIDRYLGLGLRMQDAWRAGDSLGLALARAHVRRGPDGPGGAETVWEMTWATPVGRYLSVQPDLQYVRRPGADGRVPDAWVVGMRLQLDW